MKRIVFNEGKIKEVIVENYNNKQYEMFAKMSYGTTVPLAKAYNVKVVLDILAGQGITSTKEDILIKEEK